MITPAFREPSDRIVFLLLLALILLAPLACSQHFTRHKKDLYCSSENREISTSICYNIYVEKGPVDLLFIGFSSLWVDFDNYSFEQFARKDHSKEVKSRTLATNHPGEDLMRVFYHDFTLERSSKLVLTSQPNRATPYPHPYLHHVTTFDDLGYLVSGATFLEKVRYYGLLSLRSLKNEVAIKVPFKDKIKKFKNGRRGSNPRKLHWNSARIFQPMDLTSKTNPLTSSAVLRTTTSDHTLIAQKSEPLISSFQQNALEKFHQDVSDNGARFAFLYLPLYDERRLEPMIFKMELTRFPPETPVLGIPTSVFFGDRSDEEIQHFFYNRNHMNRNGALLFTSLVTPQLLQLVSESHE